MNFAKDSLHAALATGAIGEAPTVLLCSRTTRQATGRVRPAPPLRSEGEHHCSLGAGAPMALCAADDLADGFQMTLIEGGRWNLGAADRTSCARSRLVWRWSGGLEQHAPVLRGRDQSDGLLIDGAGERGVLTVGQQDEDDPWMSPLPCHRHAVLLDERGVHSRIKYDPAMTIELPNGCDSVSLRPGRWLRAEHTRGEARVRLYPVFDELGAESGMETLETEDDVVQINVRVVQLESAVSCSVEVQPRADAQGVHTLHVRYAGIDPVRVAISEAALSAVPLQVFALTAEEPEHVIPLTVPAHRSGQAIQLQLQTSERVISRRIRSIPLPDVPTLACWPVAIYLDGTGRVVRAGAPNVSSPDALEVATSPSLGPVKIARVPQGVAFEITFPPELPVNGRGSVFLYDTCTGARGVIPVVSRRTNI